MDFYLVTGFLGAGKTTFLKQFVRLLAPKRIHLIINEFGQESVDGALLREVGAVLAEISNGSIFCACRLDKFEEALERALAEKPDAVIAEASGLADPTGVRRVLARYPQIAYKGSICLADAVRLPKVYATAVVCRRQLAVSSLVLLNKTDSASPAQCAQARALILEANPAAAVFATRYGRMDPDWLRALRPVPGGEEACGAPDITLQKACLAVSASMDSASLRRCLAQLSESIYRIKGFVRLSDGCFLADCTGPDVQLVPWSGPANNRLVLLAGRGMPLRAAVRQALDWYGAFLTEAERP